VDGIARDAFRPVVTELSPIVLGRASKVIRPALDRRRNGRHTRKRSGGGPGESALSPRDVEPAECNLFAIAVNVVI